MSTGIARFGLVDLCLPSRPAIVSITIVGIHSLVVDVADNLQRGKQTLCSVHILDTMGNPLQVRPIILYFKKKNFITFVQRLKTYAALYISLQPYNVVAMLYEIGHLFLNYCDRQGCLILACKTFESISIKLK